MRRSLKAGKTLLVDGPASVTLISGEASALGAPLRIDNRVIVRSGKRIPFLALKDSEFEVLLGESASLSEVDGSTIPNSWKLTVDEILKSRRNSETVLVMGGIDCGKTSFCIYLANIAIAQGLTVALIDGDLGQSDIGPPTTLGIGYLREPIVDPFNVEPKSLIFLGVTSPSRVVKEVIKSLAKLRRKALDDGLDLTIINTDGWIDGEDAVEYKVRLVEETSPNIVVGIQQSDELNPILNMLRNVTIFKIEPPETIKRRSREVRRVLRGMAYRRYLRHAKVRSLPINWVKIDGSLSFLGVRGFTHQHGMNWIEEILGFKPAYYEETPNRVLIVVDRGRSLSDEQIKALESKLGRKVIIFRKGSERGLLVGLKDVWGNLLGIGIICGIDFNRKVIKIYTPVRDLISIVHVSSVRLDRNGNEIEPNHENLNLSGGTELPNRTA